MFQFLSFWQGVSVLMGAFCLANGVVLIGMSPKKAIIEFAGISQMLLGLALTFLPFLD